MTDILLPLFFLALFYLGSALLKVFQKKQLLPPESPAQPPLETTSEFTKKKNAPPSPKLAVMPKIDKSESKLQATDESAAWRGKLNEEMLVNGVIFAEILQPPRAYRPLVRHLK